MREKLTFTVICQKLGEVELETRDWWPEPDGDSEVIHFRAKCQCGKEHVGYASPEMLNTLATAA